jgi:hypothetical protein
MDHLAGGDPAMGFELVAASIRADASDLKTFMDVLAVKLEQALPGMVYVEREGGLFKKERKVKLIRIQLDDKLYDLVRAGHGLEARLSHQVRGITLKNEVMNLDTWITELSRHLSRHAASSAEARAALERLVT